MTPADDRGARRERVFTLDEKRSLQGLTLINTTFDHVDFSGADLAESIFRGVSFMGCDFRGAILAGATFHRCDLRGALFDRSTVLRLARFDGSLMIGAFGLTRTDRSLIRATGGVFSLFLLD